MGEEKKTAPAELDAAKIVECLRLCATGDYRDCRACPYRKDCNQLLLDAIALLETGYNLKEVNHE